MTTTVPKTGSKTTSASQRGGAAISRAKRAAYGEIKQGVKHLEKSIGEIQRGLHKAEQQIDADARARVRELRKDAHTQLAVVKGKQREVLRILKNVSAAAEGSWRGEAVGGRDPRRCPRHRRVGRGALAKGLHALNGGASRRAPLRG
jgi:hypothetical protein